jgi:hypothetical protein
MGEPIQQHLAAEADRPAPVEKKGILVKQQIPNPKREIRNKHNLD